MTADRWLVLAGGIAGTVAVNWWFFVAARQGATATARATTSHDATQRVEIAVDGGYSPSTVRVRAGEPVTLVFDRRETNPCSEEVVLPDFGIRHFLPAHERTTITVRPERAGTYEFTCGMQMLRGRIVAE